jgi:hypothetical protein
MAQAVGPLLDIVARRVFDEHNTGTSRTVLRDLFSRAQQIICAAFDSVIVVQPMATGPSLQIYNFERIAPANDVLRIKSVRDGTRDLSRIDFERLKTIDNHWFGRSGPRFQTFAVLGRHILVIHPQRPVSSTVNVVYTQQLPALNNDADTVNLPDDQIPTLTKLVEALVLLKQRDLDKLQPLLDSLTKELGIVKQQEPGQAA